MFDPFDRVAIIPRRDAIRDAGFIVERIENDGEVRYVMAAPGGAAALESRLLREAHENQTRMLALVAERLQAVEQALRWHGRIVQEHMPSLRKEGRRT
mgnify:CR=1 FL=1